MGNKHLSVLMLYVRGAIAPLISIMVLMAAVQTGLSLWSVQRGVSTLEALVQSAHWRFVFFGGVILLVAMLSRTYGGGYTIRRLRISERAVFLWHSLACFCCFVLLWMVEIIVSTVLCRYFLSHSSANDLSGQALFLAFYRSDFLHSLLPVSYTHLVASSDYRQDMRISKDRLKHLSQNYLKIRNTARYMLGNLFDFDPKTDLVAYDQLPELDKWALMRLKDVYKRQLFLTGWMI